MDGSELSAGHRQRPADLPGALRLEGGWPPDRAPGGGGRRRCVASPSGDNCASTVRVWVNGLEWSEVRSFYRQPPDAQVFLTREDEQGKTHVVFGDGRNGARLPTGVNNVVASYRYGGGAAAPAAGALTGVLNPMPGVRGRRHPGPVGGRGDPDPPDSG